MVSSRFLDTILFFSQCLTCLAVGFWNGFEANFPLIEVNFNFNPSLYDARTSMGQSIAWLPLHWNTNYTFITRLGHACCVHCTCVHCIHSARHHGQALFIRTRYLIYLCLFYSADSSVIWLINQCTDYAMCCIECSLLCTLLNNLSLLQFKLKMLDLFYIDSRAI